MAAIGAAFTQTTPALFILASASAFLFWAIEALWKSFQQAYYPRIREIEDFMRGAEGDEFSSPDIAHSWSAAWRKTSFARIMLWGHVCLPHVAIAFAGILLWLWSLFCPMVKKIDNIKLCLLWQPNITMHQSRNCESVKQAQGDLRPGDGER